MSYAEIETETILLECSSHHSRHVAPRCDGRAPNLRSDPAARWCVPASCLADANCSVFAKLVPVAWCVREACSRSGRPVLRLLPLLGRWACCCGCCRCWGCWARCCGCCRCWGCWAPLRLFPLLRLLGALLRSVALLGLLSALLRLLLLLRLLSTLLRLLPLLRLLACCCGCCRCCVCWARCCVVAVAGAAGRVAAVVAVAAAARVAEAPGHAVPVASRPGFLAVRKLGQQFQEAKLGE